MGDTEIRRTLRVVFTAVESVREAYRHTGGAAPAPAPGQRRGGASPSSDTGLPATLERAGKLLWEAQGLLLSDGLERHCRRLKASAADLRKVARRLDALGRRSPRATGAPAGRSSRGADAQAPDLRDVVDAVTDAADALTAIAEIVQLSVEAGLAG